MDNINERLAKAMGHEERGIQDMSSTLCKTVYCRDHVCHSAETFHKDPAIIVECAKWLLDHSYFITKHGAMYYIYSEDDNTESKNKNPLKAVALAYIKAKGEDDE